MIGTYPESPRWGRDGAHGPVSGGCGERRGWRGRELGDDATAEQAAVRVVQGARLPWRDGPHRLGEVEGDRPAHLLPHPAGNGRGAVAALYQNRIPRRQRVGEPVELRERHAVAEQLVPRADHDFARLGTDRDHVHRLAEPAGQTATLPDGIAREARMLPHHGAAGRHQRPRRERRRVGGQMTLEHAHIVIIRDEADLHRLDLFGGDEAEAPGDGSRLALGQVADGRQHPRHHAPVDAPEEVGLVFPGIAPAEQRAIVRDRVMAGGHVRAVERVRVVQEVAELGERVAAHARDGRAAARVLGDEVGDHVAAEAIFEIQDVVRDPELVRHEPGVGDRIEGAARTVGDGVAVAEQLHGGADHVVPFLHQDRRSDRAVDSPGHGDENPLCHLEPPPRVRNVECGMRSIRGGSSCETKRALPFRIPHSTLRIWFIPHSTLRIPHLRHRCKTADRALTFSTIFGRAAMTVSMSSSVFSLPNENRSAATPRSRGTPIAVRTCDGSTAPVEQAEPDEQAIPARARCIRSASLSVPGIDTLVTCGARRPFAALITASGTTASSRRSSSSRRAATRAANVACSRAASSTAAPDPTTPGTFAVPGRVAHCRPTPWMIASMTWRSRTTSAPMPLGAPTLWPETVKRVHATSDNETGILPKACTPSTWNGTPASRHRAANRATGWTTPISLFTHITPNTATPRASPSLST